MKKLVALLLSALLLASLASTAYAVPDRMTSYMLQTILTDNEFSFTIGEDTEAGAAVRQSIYDAVDNNRLAPIEWWTLDRFGAPVKSAAQVLTEGSVETMTLCSFVSVDVSGYDEKFSDEQAVFHFTNAYPAELKFVAVAGALKDGMAERLANGEAIDPTELYDWQALRAEPVDPDAGIDTDDGICVYFTQDALTMVNDKDAVVALLCEVKSGTYTEEIIETPGTPSKTVDDVTTIKIYDDNGIENLIVNVVDRQNADVQKEYDNVYRHVVTESKNVIDYFCEDVRAEIQELLPDVSPDTLVMNDFIGVIVHNYTYAHGEILVDAAFPTVYADGEKVIALAGVFKDDDSVIWTPLKAQVANGAVRITLTQNIATRFENATGVLMILRAPMN